MNGNSFERRESKRVTQAGRSRPEGVDQVRELIGEPCFDETRSHRCSWHIHTRTGAGSWPTIEHWDGQGYPDHGAGEAIPPGVRRIVFVDSQDALTSPRLGREALTTEQGRADLHWYAWSYVDPLVVEMFLCK